jgi:hypothetical protein
MANDDIITATWNSPEVITAIVNHYATHTCRNTDPLTMSTYLDCTVSTHICRDRRECGFTLRFTMRDEWVIHDFAGMEVAKRIGLGDIHMKLCITEHCEH